MRILRISPVADADIASALTWSVEHFGEKAHRRYQILITTALEDLCANPDKIGSVKRPEFGAGLRSYHLRFSRRDARTAEGVVHRLRHMVVYRPNGDSILEVVRVLHDGMELKRHLGKVPGDRQAE